MSTVTDQYTEFAKQGQEALTQAIDALTRATPAPTAWLTVPTTPEDVTQAVASAFDYAATLLDIQRTFTKQVTAVSVNAVETVTRQVTDAAKQATNEATSAA